MSLFNFLEKVLNRKIEILEKEIKFFKHTLRYFNGVGNGNIDKVFKGLEKNIEEIEEKFENVKNIDINKNIDTNKDNFFKIYNISKKYYEIDEIIKNLGFLFKTLFQNAEIGLNHYLPKPNFGKSFSYKALNEYLIERLEELRDVFLDENYKILLFWDFIDGEKNIPYKDILYIKSNFYHQNMPVYFVLYAHEIGHLLAKKNEKLKKTKKKILKHRLFKIYRGEVEEIFADCFGILVYGDAYILSLMSQLIDNSFYINFGDNYSLEFDNKRLVLTLIRLNVIYLLYDEINSLQLKKIKVKDLLEEYFDIFRYDLKEKFSKSVYFEDYYNRRIAEIIEVSNLIAKEIKPIIKDLKKQFDVNKVKDKEIFVELWEEFLENNLDMLNVYREKLLKPFFEKIKNFSNKKSELENPKNDLIEHKTDREKLLKLFFEKIKNLFNKKSELENPKNDLIEHKKIVFGKVANHQIFDSDIEKVKALYRKYNFAFSIFDFIEIVNNNYENKLDEINYFYQESLVIKIYDNEKNVSGDMIGIIFIKTESSFDMKNLINAFETIKEKIENIDYKAEIYKSLGPKDFAVIVYGDLKTIYQLKKELMNKFEKTHTYICLNHSKVNKDTEIELGSFSLKAVVRVTKDFDVSSFKNNWNVKMTTGVFDYEMVYKNESIKLEDFFSIIANNNVKDVQFKIDEEMG